MGIGASPRPGFDPNAHMHGGQYHSHPSGDRPHSHEQPARNNARILKFAGGITIIIVAIPGMFAPWLSLGGTRFSVSQAHSLCGSALGQFAQGLSSGAAADCGAVNAGYYALIVAAIAGVALIIWGFVTPSDAARQSISEIKRPPGYR